MLSFIFQWDNHFWRLDRCYLSASSLLSRSLFLFFLIVIHCTCYSLIFIFWRRIRWQNQSYFWCLLCIFNDVSHDNVTNNIFQDSFLLNFVVENVDARSQLRFKIRKSHLLTDKFASFLFAFLDYCLNEIQCTRSFI